MAVELEGV